jgi:hypothetical protein
VGRQTRRRAERQQSSYKQVRHKDAKAPKNTNLDLNQNTNSRTLSMPDLFIYLFIYFTVPYLIIMSVPQDYIASKDYTAINNEL